MQKREKGVCPVRSWKSVLALTLAVCLLLPLLRGSCHAAESYIITVTEDTVQEDTADPGMAMYLDGLIYVPYTTLSQLNRTWVAYNESKSLVTVYRVGYIIYFELNTGLTYNQDNRYVQVSAKMRSGVPYLPVQVICNWMGLYFSYTSASASGLGYPIVRLARETPAVSDETLYRQQAATLEAVAKSRDIRSGLLSPEVTPPAPEPEERDITLLFAGVPEGDAAPLLDTLEAGQTPAAFFLSPGDVTAQGALLREIYCRGFSLGILLAGEDPLEEAKAGSEAYADTLHCRVRLVLCSRALTEEEVQTLAENGFVPVAAEQDYSRTELTSQKLLSALKKLLRTGDGGERLLLRPDSMVQELLPVVCSYLVAQNYTALPLHEWTQF